MPFGTKMGKQNVHFQISVQQKNGVLSTTSISASMLGHVPIVYLKLNVFLYL